MCQMQFGCVLIAFIVAASASQTADRPARRVNHFFLWFKMPAVELEKGVTEYSPDEFVPAFETTREWLESIGATPLHKIYPEYFAGDTIRTTRDGKRVCIRDLSQRFVVLLDDSIEWRSVAGSRPDHRLLQIALQPFDLGKLLMLKGLHFKADPGIFTIPLDWAETE